MVWYGIKVYWLCYPGWVEWNFSKRGGGGEARKGFGRDMDELLVGKGVEFVLLVRREVGLENVCFGMGLKGRGRGFPFSHA